MYRPFASVTIKQPEPPPKPNVLLEVDEFTARLIRKLMGNVTTEQSSPAAARSASEFYKNTSALEQLNGTVSPAFGYIVVKLHGEDANV
jgi:hypothetical protein